MMLLGDAPGCRPSSQESGKDRKHRHLEWIGKLKESAIQASIRWRVFYQASAPSAYSRMTFQVRI
jgi:hypothetical protein